MYYSKKALELTLNYLDDESDSSKIVCNVCNGKRKLKIKEDNPISYYCPKCHGKGKLDWVENIVGYKNIV
jgi:DnaJ-class molecular chaperone